MIGITGASGILGRALLSNLRDMGVDVLPIHRSSRSDSKYFWDLKDPIPPSFSDFDLIIHCAFSFSDARKDNLSKVGTNLIGARQLASWGAAKGVRIINLSSVTAASVETKYGLEKRKIEEIMDSCNHINLRLGVIDSSPPIGIVARYLNSPEIAPKIFLNYGTKYWVSNLNDVTNFLHSLCLENKAMPDNSIYLVNEKQESLPDLIRRAAPNKILFALGVPCDVLIPIVKLFKKFVVSLEPLYDQIIGVKTYKSSGVGQIEFGWKRVKEIY